RRRRHVVPARVRIEAAGVSVQRRTVRIAEPAAHLAVVEIGCGDGARVADGERRAPDDGDRPPNVDQDVAPLEPALALVFAEHLLRTGAHGAVAVVDVRTERGKVVLAVRGIAADHRAERDDLVRAGELLDERHDLRDIDALDLVGIIEVADGGLALDEHEAVALELELARDRARIADYDLVRPIRPLRLVPLSRIENHLLSGNAEIHLRDDRAIV